MSQQAPENKSADDGIIIKIDSEKAQTLRLSAEESENTQLRFLSLSGENLVIPIRAVFSPLVFSSSSLFAAIKEPACVNPQMHALCYNKAANSV